MFTPRKCKVATGRPRPASTAPRGDAYRLSGPQFRNCRTTAAPRRVIHLGDQHNTFGLGANVPIATGNMSDSYFALVDGKWVTLRVPYPMGFFAKWGEARIDDPNAGWKGRSLWATSSTRTVFHVEGGKENRPKVVKFQLRPDPLAR